MHVFIAKKYVIYLNKTKFKPRSSVNPAIVNKDRVHYTLKFWPFLIGVFDLIGNNDGKKKETEGGGSRGRDEGRDRRYMSWSDLGIYCAINSKKDS